MKRLTFLLALFLLALLIAGSVNATTIISPNAVINNTLGEYDSTLAEEYMIDQSGLSIGFDSGVTDFDSYLSLNPTHIANTQGTLWGSNRNETSGVVDFDLGSVFNISNFVVWSDASQSGDSGAIKNFNLYASLLADFSSAINLGGFIGELGPTHPDPIPTQVFSFGLADARYIRLEILDQYGDPNVNIHEVAFGIESAPVPEPTTFLLLGFGLLGIAGVSRKKYS